MTQNPSPGIEDHVRHPQKKKHKPTPRIEALQATWSHSGHSGSSLPGLLPHAIHRGPLRFSLAEGLVRRGGLGLPQRHGGG